MMNQTGPVTAEGMTVPTAVRSSPPQGCCKYCRNFTKPNLP